MRIRWCVLLQKVQLFHLSCLCRRALYFMIDLLWALPICSLVCCILTCCQSWVCLYLSSHVYGSSCCCKVKCNNPLAAVLKLFWITLSSQSLSHLVYSLKSKREDKCSFLLLEGTCLWLQVVFWSNLKIFFSLLFLHLCQTYFSLVLHPKVAVLCNP